MQNKNNYGVGPVDHAAYPPHLVSPLSSSTLGADKERGERSERDTPPTLNTVDDLKRVVNFVISEEFGLSTRQLLVLLVYMMELARKHE